MSRGNLFLFKWLGLIVALVVPLIVVPSLVVALIEALMFFALADYFSRKRRNSVRAFNAAMRSVCRHEGAIDKVALAFSRSGPLSASCYEYTRRLMMGVEPVQAALESRVPLQLQTVIAMRTSPSETPPAQTRKAQTPPALVPPAESAAPKEQQRDGSAGGMSFEDRESAMATDAVAPAYGQLLYLVGVTVVTCCVLAFSSLFIKPTISAMLEEFGVYNSPPQRMFTMTPVIGILLLLTLVILIVAPLLNRGHLLGWRFPSFVPVMPRLAERNADVLNGLADGVDAGWPLGRILSTGHEVAIRYWERSSYDSAMRKVLDGYEPIEAIRAVGWIDHEEASWLVGASPQRTAQLLRTFAARNTRDATANLRWIMAIFFPVLLLLLGAAVMGFAISFFASLSGLIHGLS